MPVYEYLCSACGARFSRFFRALSAAGAAVACAQCGAAGARRAISTFAVHQTLKTQIENIDPAFERQIDDVMKPHLATDPLNRVNLDFGSDS